MICHKYGSEGYEGFYRLQQCLGDAEFHRIDLNNDLRETEAEMCMSVNREIVEKGLVDILIEMNWLDKELYEKENILWSDKFVKSIRVVYINRRKQVPSKEDIHGVSTCKNESIVKYNIEKDRKEKDSRVEDDSLLSLREYEEVFPKKDIRTSLKN